MCRVVRCCWNCLRQKIFAGSCSCPFATATRPLWLRCFSLLYFYVLLAFTVFFGVLHFLLYKYFAVFWACVLRVVWYLQIASRASREVQIDRSVWKAHENMPLNNVYLLFANLRCIRLFVIAGDRLTGIISRSILYNVRFYSWACFWLLF